MAIYPKLIIDALTKVRYPGSGKDLVSAGMVDDDIRIDGNKVSFSLLFEKPNDPFIKSVVKAAETAILTYVDKDVDIKGNISVVTRQQARPEPDKLLPQVKNIIAVSSGKGGVGKSTVAANLAVALAGQGYKVGLLDADIFGPSQPKMFQVEDFRPVMVEAEGRELIEPAENYGVKLLSIGFFVNKEDAVLWRGAMASNALKQLIGDANWDELDYFLIDLPPGTSDIHLTMVQTLAITGAIVVTTPQDVALADARKGVSMFLGDKVNVPVLGLVENMAWFTPAELPENKYYIFGQDGGKRLAEELQVPLLGQIPIVQSIREGGDKGEPVALHTDSITGAAFHALAENVVSQVAYRNDHQAPTQRVEITKK
ncbi:ATP-binding protein involved in chromosome partitioning [Parabacteroides sp. PF5-5]|uniref:Mrp/NBP35 family ATP-binding protein n=1 Tax=unclassified Parabacteroides TaxID=2649774 RepID=UPI0024758C74|nr:MULTISPECIES: Mrp/NBP35 family ATP-binding protein [unclassified Parabacteroides]MDH6304902.1 ATP-binding protein involved in chromosome partitioning [Parabacteroides sp. PH5-39]MDH6316012.1 ATP-binding protein involved in chromosome partitioning [Parabacteroides sp. PF5-13]MDH6319669.1 ATP-binding protein involved in chromosome partitioning [Parabacteroides sp. PH5-13]MDH6323400.1 ATP-binding protein involved in chromosome partitioning [Parabacteroides sp. PH5-8]MDH6327091.1 ATP-binding pr